MIHLWYIDNNDNLVLDIKELLKYPILAKIYQNDISTEKTTAREFFKYIDFRTSSTGYIRRNGLNDKEAHKYALSQTKLSKDFIFPNNLKTILDFVSENLEYDVVATLVTTAIKALRVSTKSLNVYIDNLNELESSEYKDKEGNPIDISALISKALNTISNIPKDITNLEKLLELQKSSKAVVRGSTEYKNSMDGDDSLESYADSDDDDE